MRTVTLNILAEDIRTTDYFNQQDCAITRAFKRAGVDARDAGTIIYPLIGEEEIGEIDWENKSKILNMYRSPQSINYQNMSGWREYSVEPQDFSFEVELNID